MGDGYGLILSYDGSCPTPPHPPFRTVFTRVFGRKPLGISVRSFFPINKRVKGSVSDGNFTKKKLCLGRLVIP